MTWEVLIWLTSILVIYQITQVGEFVKFEIEDFEISEIWNFEKIDFFLSEENQKRLWKIVLRGRSMQLSLRGKQSDWKGLPNSKSLFYSGKGCGLPIGNLTSQLFFNVYLNDFDHFVKRDLKIRYYGRYVDNFVLLHNDKEYLKLIIPRIRQYLQDKLKLKLDPGKIYSQHYTKGVQYLGAVIKPYRIYPSKRIRGNFYS